MAKFETHETSERTSVVLWAPSRDYGGPPPRGRGRRRPRKTEEPHPVVVISRSVGNPTARALMRLCQAVLAEDEPRAQRELDNLSKHW